MQGLIKKLSAKSKQIVFLYYNPSKVGTFE